jgi:hypothetical protein
MIASIGRRSADSSCWPQSAIAGCRAERYSARMHWPVSGPRFSALERAAGSVIPAWTRASVRGPGGPLNMAPTNSSPAPSVCQTWARSCQT